MWCEFRASASTAAAATKLFICPNVGLGVLRARNYGSSQKRARPAATEAAPMAHMAAVGAAPEALFSFLSLKFGVVVPAVVDAGAAISGVVERGGGCNSTAVHCGGKEYVKGGKQQVRTRLRLDERDIR